MPEGLSLRVPAQRRPSPVLLEMKLGASSWRLFLDTAAECPSDIYPDLEGPAHPVHGVVSVEPHSMVVYVAVDMW